MAAFYPFHGSIVFYFMTAFLAGFIFGGKVKL
jgi:hypothetical protein